MRMCTRSELCSPEPGLCKTQNSCTYLGTNNTQGIWKLDERCDQNLEVVCTCVEVVLEMKFLFVQALDRQWTYW